MNKQEKFIYNKAVKDCSIAIGYLSLKDAISFGGKKVKTYKQIQRALSGLRVK